MRYLKSILKKFRVFFLLFLLVFIIALPIYAQIEKKGMILFYNPETNINNFASVKAMFDKYLSEYGEYRFQPFNKRKIFENSVGKIDSSTLVIASSWHFRTLNKKSSMIPLLIAIRDGKFTFKKILLARKPISTIEDIAGKTVASSSSKKYTLSLLREMFGEDKSELLSKIKILIVPKDIDALMSVSFGVAQAAITTETSLKQIEQVNPNLKKKLTRLLTSGEILMPIVSCRNKASGNEIIDELTEILVKMNTTESGRKKLAALSMDGWRSISPDIMEMLNK